MVRLSGSFDPEAGLRLTGRLARAVEALFHGAVPDGCPDDAGARQDFLRAHALLALITPGARPAAHVAGGGSCRCNSPDDPGSWVGERVDVSLVVDARTLLHGPHGDTSIDLGVPGLELPVDTVRRLACLADVSVLAVDRHGVVLNHGRTRRLATRAQRRALRVMYTTCAVPGCTVTFDRCEPHHVVWFRNGGATDLDNLTHR
jgi:hypothetical protein